MPAPQFAFVQLEFPFALGPADGRYVIRGPGGLPSHVLVVATLGAPENRTLIGRKRRVRDARAEPSPEPAPVPTTRVTLIRAEPFGTPDEAAAWRSDVVGDDEVAAAFVVVNGVLHAFRAAAADPHVREVSRAQALAVRIGTGEGEQVASGKWTEATSLGDPRSRGRAEHVQRPHERLAAVLSGRDVALACEELTIRARLDIDNDRSREAALQLRVALEAAIAELAPWADRGDVGRRISDLRDARGEVGRAANAALEGGLDEDTIVRVEYLIGRVEAALRARTAAEMG